MTRTELISKARPTLVTQTEAADILGVTSRTVRTMICDGRLRGHKIGRRAVRLHLEDVVAVLKPMRTY